MTRPAPRWLLALPLLAALAGAARGQGFGDYETAGRSEDVRREASPLSVGGHSLRPTIDTKLLGLITPHVFGAAGFGYTSNLLRGDEEVRGAVLEDEYFRGELGARLDTLLGDHRIELDGRGRVTEYLESGDYDTVEGRASARLDLLFTDVEVHGDLSWSRTAYPQTQQLTGIVRLDTYRAGLWVEGRVGRFGVRVGAWAVRPDYVDRDLEDLDYTSVGGDLQVYGRILPKLRGVLEYAWSRLVYDEGDQGTLDDYDVHRVWTGLDGELTEKLTASLKVGASFQDLRSDVNADTREFRGFTAACSVRWQPLPHTTLDGGWSRSIDPSVNSNYLLTDAFHLAITQQVWEERISLSARGGYSHGAVRPGRHLNTFSAGASASWQVRDWLSLRAGYAFQRLNSAFTLAEAAVSDYTVHEAELSLGIGF